MDTRRKALLIALGALLLIGAWRSLQPFLRDEKTVPSAAMRSAGSSGVAGNSGLRPGDRLATLHLRDLDRIPSGSTGGRDPWRFIDLQSPSPATEPVQTVLPVLPSTAPQPQDPALTAAPAPPDLDLEYLGNFGPPQRKIAVFSNGKGIYNVQEGDVIDGKFIVARIGYESVDIRFVDFPGVPARRVGIHHR